MEITEVFTNSATLAAVVRGFPAELAWSTQRQNQGSVSSTPKTQRYIVWLHRLPTKVVLSRKTYATEHERSAHPMNHGFPPLVEGKHWAYDLSHEDFLYWHLRQASKPTFELTKRASMFYL